MDTSISSVMMLLGRVSLAAIFVMSGVHKLVAWSETAGRMTSEGMTAVPVFLAGAVACELLGGLSVILGWWARLGAVILVLFLIPVTGIFHDFWTYEGAEQQAQMIHFMKNLAILGGLCLLTGAGPGGLSIDGWRTRQ
ncbi:MAG: DoxX family protein [Pirellulaceae bacterium]